MQATALAPTRRPAQSPPSPAGAAVDFAWTDERVERLKVLWAAGRSANQIAIELGTGSRSSVLGKVHRLGLSGRRDLAPKPERPATVARNPMRKVAAAATAVPPAVLPAPEPIEETVPHDPPPSQGEGASAGVDLFDLRSAHCRWPVGQPDGPHPLLWGPRTPDRPQNDLPCPYCAFHAAMAYQPQRSERQRAGDESRRRLAFERERQKRAAAGEGVS